MVVQKREAKSKLFKELYIFDTFAIKFGCPHWLQIAVYYTFVRKQKSNASFLLGDRALSALPISFSLAVSYLSAVTITGKGSSIYDVTIFVYVIMLTYWYILTIGISGNVLSSLSYFGLSERDNVRDNLDMNFGEFLTTPPRSSIVKHFITKV